MNYLVLILVLLMAAPPVQAVYCEMDAGQVEQLETGSHDCCPDETADEPESPAGCNLLGHCGSCLVSSSAIPVVAAIPALPAHPVYASFLVPGHSPNFDSPPFRPPIS